MRSPAAGFTPRPRAWPEAGARPSCELLGVGHEVQPLAHPRDLGLGAVDDHATPPEISVTAAAIFLAGRNNIHTWWLGIVGCALFAWVFYEARLYADVTLQGFLAYDAKENSRPYRVPVDGTSPAQRKTATLAKRTVWDLP